MTTPLDAIFNVVIGTIHFVINHLNILGRKMRFSGSKETSISEKLIFGLLEVIFLNVYNFPRKGGCFLLVLLRWNNLNEIDLLQKKII